VREALRVVPKDFIFGTIVQSRQGINAVKNIVDLLSYAFCVTAATETLETIAKSIGDGGGQRLTRFFGDFAGEFFGFWILDAERHRWMLADSRI
jgi:hypothetical protein